MNALIPTNDRQSVHENWTACSDEMLVSAAKGGNLVAFNVLCERYSPRTLRKIYCITKDWEDAEDALQDALLKAFTHLKTFEGRCPLFVMVHQDCHQFIPYDSSEAKGAPRGITG
jgi:RNA polymerase sigma-70 factor, ECF subfamily